jgi:hypothetical protein
LELSSEDERTSVAVREGVEFFLASDGTLPGKRSFFGLEGLRCHHFLGPSSEDEDPFDLIPPQNIYFGKFTSEDEVLPWCVFSDG